MDVESGVAADLLVLCTCLLRNDPYQSQPTVSLDAVALCSAARIRLGLPWGAGGLPLGSL